MQHIAYSLRPLGEKIRRRRVDEWIEMELKEGNLECVTTEAKKMEQRRRDRQGGKVHGEKGNKGRNAGKKRNEIKREERKKRVAEVNGRDENGVQDRAGYKGEEVREKQEAERKAKRGKERGRCLKRGKYG